MTTTIRYRWAQSYDRVAEDRGFGPIITEEIPGCEPGEMTFDGFLDGCVDPETGLGFEYDPSEGVWFLTENGERIGDAYELIDIQEEEEG